MYKHLLKYAPAKIIPGLINFFSLMIFARIFTPSELGNYNYIMSILTLGSATIFSWIRLSSFRFFNIYLEKFDRSIYYSYVFSLNFIFSIVIFSLIIVPFLFGYYADLYKLFIIGSIAILINVFFEQAMSLTRSELDSKSFAIYSIIQPVIKLIIILFLTQILLLNEISIFLGIIISGVALLIYYIYKINKVNRIKLFFFAPWKNKEITKDFFHYGYPLTFSFLFSIILSTSDRIIIKYYLNNEAVGIYSLGYDITSFVILNIFMIINFSFFPVILKIIDSNKIEEARIKIKDYYLLQNLVLIPVTLFLFLFAEDLAKYILGDSYNNPDTIMTIRLISVATFISGIKAYYFDLAFQIGKKTKLQMYPVVIAAFLNILLNFMFIPKFGLAGAIYSTIIAYFFSLVLSIILGTYAFKLTWFTRDLGIIVVQLSLFVLLFLLLKVDVNTLVDSFINLVIYVILLCIYMIANFKKILKILK